MPSCSSGSVTSWCWRRPGRTGTIWTRTAGTTSRCLSGRAATAARVPRRCAEYCCAELGALLGVGIFAARLLIADALDVRYRLPRLWDRVRTGGVRAWQARKVAETTRLLSAEAAADLDYALADSVGMMPWPRFRRILAAAVLDADPDLAAERERARPGCPGRVRVRLRGRVEDHRGQSRRRRCGVVPGGGEPDRRDSRRPRGHRPGRGAAGPGGRHPGPAGRGAAAADRPPTRPAPQVGGRGASRRRNR